MRLIGWLAAAALAFSQVSAEAAGIEVVWAAPKLPVTSYVIERRLEKGDAAFASIAQVGPGDVRFVDEEVEPGLRYCYRVRGVLPEGPSSPSAPLCAEAIEQAVSRETAVAAESAARPSAPATSLPPVPGSSVRGAPSERVAAARPARTSAGPVPRLASLKPAAVRPGDREAKVLRRSPAVYPREALRKGLEGRVKLRFTVTSLGTTKNIRVVRAEPPGVFEHAAADAVSRFTYSPRIRSGRAVERDGVETEVAFILRRPASAGVRSAPH